MPVPGASPPTDGPSTDAAASPADAAAARTVLARSVTTLPGVGSRRADALAKLGIRRLADLLLHIPMRYERHVGAESIEQAERWLGSSDRTQDQVTVVGDVVAVRLTRGRRTRIEATLQDETGTLHLTWFNAPWLRDRLHPGLRIRCVGKVERAQGFLRMTNPRWSSVDPDEMPGSPPSDAVAAPSPSPTSSSSTPAPAPGDVAALIPGHEAATLQPVYPATESLGTRAIARLVAEALPVALPVLVDHLPEAYRRERDLLDLATAFERVHRPADEADAARARRRLAFDELLLLQLAVMMKRAERRQHDVAPALRRSPAVGERIEARLPFAYTDDQRRAVTEIAADLEGPHPMNRLLQGDVGAGKTVVALDAMLVAVASGHQAALVAPTELLAEQHHRSIARLLDDSDVTLTLLTGSIPAPARRARTDGLADGSIDIVVGTHALFSESTVFHRLGLAVIDEQHRFGVEQRAAVRAKGDRGTVPHVLVMTATPIPRTLALTVYGDLDVSVLRSLPPGRSPVRTRRVTPARAGDVYAHLAERVADGQQGYVVVPSVAEDTDLLDVASHLEALRAGPLASARLAGVHGRLGAEERAEIMQRFHDGDLDVLVATTVIEVGVDVPNATMMVIEHADRFGLAQLHQLRGRVGRGARPGVCALIAEPVTDDGARRLEAIVGTTDGFAIAEADLEIRGPGEFFGARQSGVAPFRVADLVLDADVLRVARRDAEAWIDRSPSLDAPGEQVLRERVFRRHGAAFGLGDVG